MANTPAAGTEVFKRSPKPTVGIEWEVALINPETWDLAHQAEAVIATAQQIQPDIHLEKEFLQNTIELVTGICDSIPQAVAELDRDLAVIRQAAEHHGLVLWASGGHPFSDFRTNPVSAKMTYAEIIERTQYWGSQMLIWGTHVHVGISHEDRVWPIINAMMTKFPHLLALSASSPGWDGIDTGYASNRTMLYQQLPTAGLPPAINTWEQWQGYMRDQAASGVISHTGSMHLDIRPASKWGTIEVRVSDASSNLRELSAVAALTHCLVVYYDRMLDEQRADASNEAGSAAAGALRNSPHQLPSLQPWHIAENKWRAARYGLDALVITSRDTHERWVKDELADLVEQLAPIAEELGCARELQLVSEIVDKGAGYQRQRQRFAQSGGDWKKVVAATAEEMSTWRPLE
ncbi:glutamate--cysteine ligase [Corynebacterium propinquum]|uniref:Putative glutamate--cysteine ligase 2 n=1 Tax=Corynebacterium propinquum TaxID=43769 RepID=A0AAP4BTJ2_9CORY|nr:glutamate--cysteine ligase [Corynebacterium propinquum]MCG7231216.1 glutamate--cysteine ligase [Corynebacterium propinquum]MCT1818134.1 glutamate--cysteine ligase [Corynebacterium propinquum]MDK4234915.1 glutamate--cysteine ligase [Corynebacterium propinquum]MDK4238410.1 glutamate--cysteine ligase [Corynebacterium propinquum]MDK4300741.1 glutamate--cysteine ligase [Corynebacterium propinquum]